ncbi:MAG TPA: type II toxin-antitoxin system RelE/ParE family toxin [Kofleriaceae bacterium]|nr:type II toxin-antitoxin system RelE/ParE family toxin [Kofleriaceae bacterium]
MAWLRVSRVARADLEHILAVSLERWGDDGAARYRALLAAALRAIATAPDGPTTRDRSRVLPGIRSFHLRHARADHEVRDPVHVVYYRLAQAGSLEVVRVLHERMDPALHLEAVARRRRARRAR